MGQTQTQTQTVWEFGFGLISLGLGLGLIDSQCIQKISIIIKQLFSYLEAKLY